MSRITIRHASGAGTVVTAEPSYLKPQVILRVWENDASTTHLGHYLTPAQARDLAEALVRCAEDSEAFDAEVTATAAFHAIVSGVEG